MKGVLLTGFEPFAGAGINPAQEIVRALDGEMISGSKVFGRCLPCVFGEARTRLDAAIETLQPELVIAIGQAANRSAVSLERLAANFIDAPIPDNAGQQPMESAVIDDAPAAYFSTLPLRRILERLRAAGIPSEISLTAGSYVCNELFYGLMHRVSMLAGSVRAAGFIHVPAQPGLFEGNRHGMSMELQTEAIRIAVLTTLGRAGCEVMSNRSEGRIS